MELNKAKNAKRNIFYGIINKIIMLALPFMIRSIIIYTLGAEYLGLNSLFSSILQVLNLSELGFSSAVVFSMYEPVAKEDNNSICGLLLFYKRVYRLIGLFVTLVGVIIIPFLPKLISGKAPVGINLTLVYCIYLVNTSISYFFLGYKVSVLEAYQRQDITSNTLSLTQLAMYIIQICLLITCHSYYIYLLQLPIFTTLTNIINAIKVKKLFPHLTPSGKVSVNELQKIRKQVPGLMITKLCYISRNSFDSIFISMFLGLNMSAIYGNYYYIMNAVVTVLLTISNALVAGVGNSLVLHTPKSNYETMEKINFLYMWIVGWSFTCLLCLYQPFMKLWVGNSMTLPSTSVILMCLYFYMLEIGVIRGVYSDAAGLWWENRYRALIEASVNLLLNYLLGKYFGLNGIIVATLVPLFFVNYLWGSNIVFDKYFKNKKNLEYFKGQALYFLVTIIVAGTTFVICSYVQLGLLTGFLAKIGICMVIPNILYLIIYNKTKIYNDSVGWLLDMLHLDKIKRVILVK